MTTRNNARHCRFKKLRTRSREMRFVPQRRTHRFRRSRVSYWRVVNSPSRLSPPSNPPPLVPTACFRVATRLPLNPRSDEFLLEQERNTNSFNIYPISCFISTLISALNSKDQVELNQGNLELRTLYTNYCLLLLAIYYASLTGGRQALTLLIF